jgi:flagellar basal-body rod protein FlgG
MAAQQQRMDATANDLANVNTTGYKRVRVGFSDLLYEQAGRPAADGVLVGKGARAVDAGRGFEQGNLRETGNPLDVAVQGTGFFKIKLSDGRQALTRDGGLHIDGNRRLATSSGALVQPAITIPEGISESDVAISSNGTVVAGGRTIGRIELVSVRSPQGLMSAGENAFVTTAASGNPVAAPAATTLRQGALEGSNTDMSQAMVDLIDAQRTYQLTSKAISTADQMMEIANQVKR